MKYWESCNVSIICNGNGNVPPSLSLLSMMYTTSNSRKGQILNSGQNLLTSRHLLNFWTAIPKSKVRKRGKWFLVRTKVPFSGSGLFCCCQGSWADTGVKGYSDHIFFPCLSWRSVLTRDEYHIMAGHILRCSVLLWEMEMMIGGRWIPVRR